MHNLCSKLPLRQSKQSAINAMVAGNAGQITPVQIMHVFMLRCTTQIMHAYNVDSCKSLTTCCLLINN